MKQIIAAIILLSSYAVSASLQETVETKPLPEDDAIEAKVLLRTFADYAAAVDRLQKELAAVERLANDQKGKILKFQLKKLEEANLPADLWIVDFQNGRYVKLPATPKVE